MLGQRHRRWPNIETTLGQCLRNVRETLNFVFIQNETWEKILVQTWCLDMGSAVNMDYTPVWLKLYRGEEGQ